MSGCARCGGRSTRTRTRNAAPGETDGGADEDAPAVGASGTAGTPTAGGSGSDQMETTAAATTAGLLIDGSAGVPWWWLLVAAAVGWSVGAES